MRKALELGGIVAALVLVGFGIGAIALGASGKSTVNDSLGEQKIVGTPDMTPSAIKAEAAKAGLDTSKRRDSDLLGREPDDRQAARDARCFAQYMNIRALEATGGLYYSQMPRYATADGKGTNVESQALRTRRASRSTTRHAKSGSRRPPSRRP